VHDKIAKLELVRRYRPPGCWRRRADASLTASGFNINVVGTRAADFVPQRGGSAIGRASSANNEALLSSATGLQSGSRSRSFDGRFQRTLRKALNTPPKRRADAEGARSQGSLRVPLLGCRASFFSS
jgi:hypothetical protein